MPNSRALSPVIGAILLVAITAVSASAFFALNIDLTTPTDPVVLDLKADASGSITIVHRGGHPIDPDGISVRIYVNGEPLAYQPPIPFFSTTGFESAPTGHFNSARDGLWYAGEAGGLVIASTNSPTPRPGDTLTVEIFDQYRLIAELSTNI